MDILFSPYKNPQHGMTLVEMLITLSLLGALTGLIFGTLSMVNKSTERAHHYQQHHQLHEYMVISLDELLGNMRPPANVKSGDFRGDSQQWTGISDHLIASPIGRPRPFRLWLKRDIGSNRVKLYYETLDRNDQILPLTRGTGSIPLTDAWVLASWPENQSPRFQYLDHEQNWRDGWSGSSPHLLPEAICLCYPDQIPELFVMRLRRTQRPPSRIEQLGL